MLVALVAFGDNSSELETKLYRPWLIKGNRFRREVKPVIQDVNSTGSLESRREWYQQNGRILSAAEMGAIKDMIMGSECRYSRPVEVTKIKAPNCATNKALFLCSGLGSCSMPGMAFQVGSRCYSNSGDCPDAKSCALKAHVDLNLQFGPDLQVPVFTNLWNGGYSVAPRK